MLNKLKSDLNRDANLRFVNEAALDSDEMSDIKDIFLDDPEMIKFGAEDDPEIASLIDKIPEYNEEDISDEELEKLAENYIPETVVMESKKSKKSKSDDDDDDDDDSDEKEKKSAKKSKKSKSDDDDDADEDDDDDDDDADEDDDDSKKSKKSKKSKSDDDSDDDK